MHVVPEPHTLPQMPQFVLSDHVSLHVPLQIVWPDAQTQLGFVGLPAPL